MDTAKWGHEPTGCYYGGKGNYAAKGVTAEKDTTAGKGTTALS